MKGIQTLANEVVQMRTNEIKIGAEYYLAEHAEHSGHRVRVIATRKVQRSDWGTTDVKILASVGAKHPYHRGETHTVNPLNLYEKQEFAAFSHKQNPNNRLWKKVA